MIAPLLLAFLAACQARSPVSPLSSVPLRTSPTSATSIPTPSPDILLIVLDDVGLSDALAVRNDGWAPNMQSVASQGFCFKNASSAPICSPTRRMMYFGEFYSRQSGTVCAPANGQEPPASAQSIAQVLTGYSRGFIGKWHVGSNPSGPWPGVVSARGWPMCRWLPHFVSGCMGQDYSLWPYVVGTSSGFSFQYQPRVLLADFETLWPAAQSPRFFVVGMHLAHSPYHVPPADVLPPGYPPVGSDARSKYEAMIAAADHQIGKILEHVDLSEDIVIIVGDNGTPPEVATDPTRAKETTFQGGVNVPFMIAGPGIPTGVSLALVSVVDVYATIAELAGYVPPVTDSKSLLPIMDGTATKVHDYIAFGIHGDVQFRDDLAARSLRYKYRRTRDDASQPWVEELYDLLTDPGELVNVAGQYPVKVAQHRAVVDQELP